ncbi:hypothetical protein [Roseisolibacter sp. H3M3-2]|uniref:hypothetical protein n=1 Tax=Roseisolibacter sp. H3M3-2 TaxID=3031323 RepID=UPI0023DADFEA|nr:hypothetical protein [Roseisolibacter sp. H3M3-2]MDF1502732.1 hypothetical protein [Roseisolibacter sp. H3M3-2]
MPHLSASLCRTALAALTLVLPGAARAQSPRLVVEPLAGWRGASDLYRHRVDVPIPAERGGGGVVSHERLRLDGGPGVGARVALGLDGWTVHAEGMRWASRHALDVGSEAYGAAGAGGSQARWEGGASVVALTGGVGRDVWAPGRRTRVGAELSGGWTRASLALLRAPDLAPSVGFAAPGLGRYDVVASRYDLPSARASLAASHAVGGRLTLRARAGVTLGRVDTHGFRRERVPAFEFAEEPTRHLARAVDATLGAAVRLR